MHCEIDPTACESAGCHRWFRLPDLRPKPWCRFQPPILHRHQTTSPDTAQMPSSCFYWHTPDRRKKSWAVSEDQFGLHSHWARPNRRVTRFFLGHSFRPSIYGDRNRHVMSSPRLSRHKPLMWLNAEDRLCGRTARKKHRGRKCHVDISLWTNCLTRPHERQRVWAALARTTESHIIGESFHLSL